MLAELRLADDRGEELVGHFGSKSRRRFFVNVVASNAGWSIRMSKNHLNNKS